MSTSEPQPEEIEETRIRGVFSWVVVHLGTGDLTEPMFETMKADELAHSSTADHVVVELGELESVATMTGAREAIPFARELLASVDIEDHRDLVVIVPVHLDDETNRRANLLFGALYIGMRKAIRVWRFDFDGEQLTENRRHLGG